MIQRIQPTLACSGVCLSNVNYGVYSTDQPSARLWNFCTIEHTRHITQAHPFIIRNELWPYAPLNYNQPFMWYRWHCVWNRKTPFRKRVEGEGKSPSHDVQLNNILIILTNVSTPTTNRHQFYTQFDKKFRGIFHVRTAPSAVRPFSVYSAWADSVNLIY